MKNIYELEPKEKSKYREEFNKLKFTKEINKVRGPALFISIFSFAVLGFFNGIMKERANIEKYINICKYILTCSAILFIISEIYLQVSFTRWMKIKHNIEY